MSGRRTVELVPVRGLAPRLLEAWAALEGEALEPNPYAGPAMVLPVAEHLADRRGSLVLVVRRGDEPELVLPVSPVAAYRSVPVPTLRVGGHPLSFLDTPLVAAGDPEAAWAAALDHLRGGRAGWLSLERLPGDGPVREALEAVVRSRGGRVAVLSRASRPMVHRRPDPTYVEGRLSTSRQRRLRRFRRRLSDALGGEVQLVDAAPRDLEGGLSRFLALEAAGWKGRAGTALTSDPAAAAVFRAVLRSAAAAGRAQVWELGHAGRVVASLCAVVAGGGAFHLKTAYDEEHAAWSPGLQLEVGVLEAFHDDASLSWIDSGSSDRRETPSRLLYPDRRPVDVAVVPVGGAASRLALAGLERVERRRAARAAVPTGSGAGDGGGEGGGEGG